MLFKKFSTGLITGLLKDLVGLIQSQYINIRPLSGSSYVQLPTELRSPKKALINIKTIKNVFYGVTL